VHAGRRGTMGSTPSRCWARWCNAYPTHRARLQHHTRQTRYARLPRLFTLADRSPQRKPVWRTNKASCTHTRPQPASSSTCRPVALAGCKPRPRPDVHTGGRAPRKLGLGRVERRGSLDRARMELICTGALAGRARANGPFRDYFATQPTPHFRPFDKRLYGRFERYA
jgi:hypothetical protein